MAPVVSIAIGMKMCVRLISAYSWRLLTSANDATAPGPVTALLRWLWASESGHVTSQTMQLPCFHGIIVKPSGRLPSDLDKDVGSNRDGTSAEASARLTRSLSAVLRVTTCWLAATETVDARRIDVNITDTFVRCADWSTETQRDSDSQRRVVKSCTESGTGQRLKESPRMRSLWPQEGGLSRPGWVWQTVLVLRRRQQVGCPMLFKWRWIRGLISSDLLSP